MQIKQANPVSLSERADILDVLRGFALLGICIANCPYFALYIFQTKAQKQALPTFAIDEWLNYFEKGFVEGKFYSLFSLLFGIGFSVILLNNQKKGKNPLPVFYRRLFVLLLIGLVHALLMWDGDILVLYASLGLLLPLFRNSSDKTLLYLAVILIFSPLVFDVLKVMSNGSWDISAPIRSRALSFDDPLGITETNISTWLILHDTYGDLLRWTEAGFYWRWDYIIGSNRIPKVFAMFLIGLYVGRKMIYANLEANKELLKKVQRWTLVVGLPASFALIWFAWDDQNLPKATGLWDTLFYALSVIPLSLFYTSTICLLWLEPVWKSKLQWLAPAGRMALTNYIMQTVLGSLIFLGIGFGLGSGIGPSVFIPVAVGVFGFQTLYSWIWLKYFNYGPLEWIWRMLTYGKYLPIQKPGLTGK